MSAPRRPDVAAADGAQERLLDPRAVRVALAPSSASAALVPLVLEPPELPVVAAEPASGGVSSASGVVRANGSLIAAALVLRDLERGLLLRGGTDGTHDRVLLLPATAAPGADRGVVRREVVVEGWRVEVEVESAARSALRERARRDRVAAGQSGSIEVRAIIPGVILSVSVSVGDTVMAGQQLLVVEAMKMQNELRAPWDGMIGRVAVGAGEKVEVGDLLIVLA